MPLEWVKIAIQSYSETGGSGPKTQFDFIVAKMILESGIIIE